MSRIPIRAKLTFAFSVALLAVLGLAAAFVLDRVDAGITESTDEGLSARLDALATLAAGSPDAGSVPGSVPADPPLLPRAPADESEDNFSQILSPDGELVASTLPASTGPALSPAEAERASEGEVLVESRDLEGVDGSARLLAGPADGSQGEGTWVVVAGTSNEDRDETLATIAAAFAIGAPLALAFAALSGWLLAGRALRPVERMRSGAERIEPGSGERLPVPAADDELRSLGLTLNSLLARQDEALEKERGFVADASHELRTPLAVLRAELEVAELEGGSPEQLRAAIGAALGEVDRLARLSDDLLVIATADRGGIPIHRESVATRELLERVAERFRRAATEREISVTAAGEERCAVDPLRVEQAVGNLVDNALRHGDGRVSIAGDTGPRGLVVEVADEGAGFDDGVAGSAFERFRRGAADRHREGAGLGLSIVRSIAEAHGGEAEIESLAPARVRVRFGPGNERR